MKPGKHQRSKQRCQDLCWKVHDPAQSFAHTLCMNHVSNLFLLVSSSVRSKQLLCFVQDQGQKTEQKHTTKNLPSFITIHLYYYDLSWMNTKQTLLPTENLH